MLVYVMAVCVMCVCVYVGVFEADMLFPLSLTHLTLTHPLPFPPFHTRHIYTHLDCFPLPLPQLIVVLPFSSKCCCSSRPSQKLKAPPTLKYHHAMMTRGPHNKKRARDHPKDTQARPSSFIFGLLWQSFMHVKTKQVLLVGVCARWWKGRRGRRRRGYWMTQSLRVCV